MPKRTPPRGPVVRFDSDAHRYWIDGREVPGITAILRAAGLCDMMKDIPRQYMIRGLAVHEWTEALDDGSLDPKMEIPPVVQPFMAAWRKFVRDARPKILAVEELVSDRLRRYATRVDRRVILNGSEWLLNLKTGGAYPFYPVQCAMEAGCYRVGLRRACVHLLKDETYCLVEHTDPRDFRVAEQAIRTYYQKEKDHARP